MIWVIVGFTAARAEADGIAIVGGSPRAIGRAGAAVVGDDGGGALLINPATIARRDITRGQLGLAVVEDSVQWQSTTQAAPLSTDQAGSRMAPIGAAIGAVGRWIVGAGMMTAAVCERGLARPGDASEPLSASYDYRYAGIAGSYRRDTMALGAARRLGNSLALGLSLGVSRVMAAEHRRMWAGFAGRGLDKIGKPESDIDLALSGTDRFVASAVAGVLYAPEDAPLELAASVAWTDMVTIDGTVGAVGTPNGPDIESSSTPRASLMVNQPVTVRAGGRYIADRFVVELDGDLWIAPAVARSAIWEVDGIRVVDPSGIDVHLWRVPSRISQRTHVAVRAAADIELIPGFLWATTGYAFATLGTPAARLSPSFGDLGGHTVGAGLEASSGGVTVTLGWSRMWAPRTRSATVLQLDNPFAAGDGPVYHGTYDAALDQVGILLEAELTQVDELLPR